MARRKTHQPLSVFLNTRHVGQLNRQPNGTVEFVYSPAWDNTNNAYLEATDR